MKEKIIKIKNLAVGSISLIIFFVIWEIASKKNLVDSSVLPAPSDVLQALFDSAKGGDLLKHLIISFQRATLGFLISLIVSISLGFLLGTFFATVEKILLPFLKMLEKLNPFALFPVFMIFFGISNMQKVITIFWVAQFPLLFHTIAGAKAVDPLMLKSARSMGASRTELFLKVILPSTLPNIFTGIKLAAQISFFMIIASEYAGSSEGLGWYFLSSHQTYQIPLSYGIIIFITVLSIIINVLFSKLEKRFLVWKETSFQ